MTLNKLPYVAAVCALLVAMTVQAVAQTPFTREKGVGRA